MTSPRSSATPQGRRTMVAEGEDDVAEGDDDVAGSLCDVAGRVDDVA
jgi:hypothetical protein